MPFVDKQGNVVYPNVGKAYAFFDCDASKKQLEKSMPEIRRDVKAPKGLQIKLHEGISELHLDDVLAEQIQYPDDYRVMSSDRLKQGYGEERKPLANMKYVFEASYNGVSNEQVAGEVGNILNFVHIKFNKDQGLFRGAVVYETNGEYKLRE